MHSITYDLFPGSAWEHPATEAPASSMRQTVFQPQLWRGGASRTERSQAEPGNEFGLVVPHSVTYEQRAILEIDHRGRQRTNRRWPLRLTERTAWLADQASSERPDAPVVASRGGTMGAGVLSGAAFAAGSSPACSQRTRQVSRSVSRMDTNLASFSWS